MNEILKIGLRSTVYGIGGKISSNSEWERMNVQLAEGEQALVRLWRIERSTLNDE